MNQNPPAPSPLAFWKWKSHWQVLLGIAAGLFLGWLSGTYLSADSGTFGLIVYGGFDLFGTLFIKSLKMIIVPLVVSSIIVSMASLKDQEGFARMGFKTLLYYMCTSLIAIVIGLGMVNFFEPGIDPKLNSAEISASVQVEGSPEAEKLAVLHKKTDGRDAGDMLNVFKELVPSNIFAAAAETKMLGLIVFSLLFGFFMSRLDEKLVAPMRSFWEGTYEVVLKITLLVLKFLPLGVCCLIALKTAEAIGDGLLVERMSQLFKFCITALFALGAHLFIVMPLILIFVAKVNPFAHFKAMAPALLTAFSTASSSATLPVTMDCVTNRSGVSKKTSGFVLPVGATVNMDGTALYECVAVMFLAQLAGIHLDGMTQVYVVFMALLTSIGVAGIPSASLVAIMIILAGVNDRLPDDQQIPEHALAIILVFDRLLDMCRTAVNIFGDSCGAVTIAKSEGETLKI